MPRIQKTIKLLKDVINDSNTDRMNLSTVKGFLGELLVKQKLEKEGKKVKYKGNQSGYDLEFDDIKIDVKFSSFKKEVNHLPRYWGWALKQGSKKKKINFTHFICVAVRDDYSVDRFYIIKARDLKEFPRGSGQFKSVKRAFSVFPNEDLIVEFKNKDRKRQFKKSFDLLQVGVAQRISKGQKLSNYLK